MAKGSLPLHAADRDIVALGARLGIEMVAVELVGAPGLAPRAVNEALARGLDHAVRVIDDALGAADAPASGLVTERVLRDVKADLVCFAATADPELAADVPAVVAFRLGAPYVPGVFELTLGATEGGSIFTARVLRSALSVTLGVPRGAVIDIDLELGRVPGKVEPTPDSPVSHERHAAAIKVVALADLGLDATLVRRRNDLRGVIEPTSRPLVTTTSIASLAALLR